jgi:hypothetical protein
MILGRFLIRQKHTRMMIKLDQDNRTLNPEVKGIVVTKTADPAKIRFAKVLLGLLEFELAGFGGVVEKELMVHG